MSEDLAPMPSNVSPIRVLGISGSLRKGSSNTALLRVAAALAPEGMTIEIADIREIPLYDEDVRSAGVPAAVQAFRDKIAAADAILFVTPEYNYSIPGVLKNAIDWASRPPAQPFAGKPIAIMGASAGMSGTMRAQQHLRLVAAALDMRALNTNEVFVRKAGSLFDADGNLQDEPTRKVVAAQLVALASWTRVVSSG